MFDNDIYAKHHRGSSPPSKSPVVRLEDWMKSCRSIDQHSNNLPEVEMLRQCEIPKIEFNTAKIASDNISNDKSSIID